MADDFNFDPSEPTPGYDPIYSDPAPAVLQNGWDPSEPTPTYNPIATGASEPGFSFSNPFSSLSGGQIGSLLGALGGLGGSLGTLLAGGQGPTTNQTGTSNTSGNTSGTTSGNTTGNTAFNNTNTGLNWNNANTNQSVQTTNNQVGTTNQTGTSNTTQTPNLNPDAQAAISRLTGLLGGSNADLINAAFKQGLTGLAGMGSPGLPSAPNTTPAAYDPGDPFAFNKKLMDVVKKSFGNTTADIASQAITGARERGFAGGADLLGTAAAPIAGQALANIPAAEAKAYLDQMLQGYVARNNAQIGGMNAATNALMPGVQAYGSQIQGQNQQIANTTSLLNALMAPYNNMVNQNLGMVSAIPHGMDTNTLSNTTGTNTLSGTTNQNTISNTNQVGGTLANQTGTGTSNQATNQTSNQTTNNTGATTGSGATTTPTGAVIGNTLGNVLAGGATGYASGANTGGLNQQTLLKLLLTGKA